MIRVFTIAFTLLIAGHAYAEGDPTPVPVDASTPVPAETPAVDATAPTLPPPEDFTPQAQGAADPTTLTPDPVPVEQKQAAAEPQPVVEPSDEPKPLIQVADPPAYDPANLPESAQAQNPVVNAITPKTSPSDGYRVQQKGNNLELVTPYGRHLIFGDQGFERARAYKLEIPLDELRPPQAKDGKRDDGTEKNKTEREVSSKEVWNTVIDRRTTSLDDPEKEKKKNDEKTEKETAPPRVIVEYDYSDRLILEANRLYNRRKFYEATLTVEELLAKRPDFARAWAMKGSLMLVQGQRDLAKSAWEKAVALDPSNTQLKQQLRRLK